MAQTSLPARPKPTYRDIVLSDGDRVPDRLLIESNPCAEPVPFDFSRYNSPDVAALENERMWPKVWQFACREEHIPETGDYYVYDIGNRSFIVVRTENGIKAFFNSCRHRGTKLKASGAGSYSADIRCPYHGWTWSLDGEITEIPCEWDFRHIDKLAYRLHEVRVEVWNTLVFINMDADAEPLTDYLEVLPEHFAEWDLSDWTVTAHCAKELPCNWKAAQENFVEAYHVATVHPQLVASAGDVNSQQDIFGRHVSRDLAPIGVPSPSVVSPLSEQALLDQMMSGEGETYRAGEHMVPEGETARSFMARKVRESMKSKYGLDLENHSTTELLDNIKYTVFPNIFIFVGISFRMIYRFRPLGQDHGRSLFEIMVLKPVTGSGQTYPAEETRIGEGMSYCEVPGLDPSFGKVFDQDTDLLRFQREGMLASKDGQGIFSQYLESRLNHHHQTMDSYLAV